MKTRKLTEKVSTTVLTLLKNAKRSKFPVNIQPMLATLVDEPFDETGWLYEVKWDGYRAVSYLKGNSLEIRSRNNRSFNAKFYPIFDALKKWDANVVIDGEIIVAQENGASSFNDLQGWRSEADGQLVYYLFDILWFDGFNLMTLPLSQRREILRLIAPESEIIRTSESFDTGARDFFEVARKMQLEGIIAKKANSVYIPGARSKEWLKIKTEQRQEAVIGGYTRNENSSKKFSALLMGLYENGDFKFIGPVGTGFSQQSQTEILQKLEPLIVDKCPFKEVPEYNKPSRFRPDPPKAEVTWVRPKLVAEISYRTLTYDGNLRHPSFKGLREDKNAEQVVRERATQTGEIVDSIRSAGQPNSDALTKKLFTSVSKKDRKTLLNPKDESQVRNVNGHDLKFSNLSKIYFPKGGVTKRDVINYYYQVAPYMLPYMKSRPQTLIRYPNGINGESFYQKDVTGKVPSWIDTFPYWSERGGNRNFLVCTDEASLLYIASIGGIEMHPWSSRVENPDNPDWCIIDLDPDSNPFLQVITAAQVVKQVLDAVGVPSYCKTSGSTGLHIYIPFGGKYTYEDSKEFARTIVKIVHEQLPAYTSIERLTEKRKGLIYLDFLQNRPQATLAAPYSLRPKDDATVSMPLHWEEVKKGLKIEKFTIHNSVRRVQDVGDIFKKVLGKGIDLTRALKKIDTVFKRDKV